MKRHANVSIFLPHGGCANRCIFCNQRAASGHGAIPAPDEVRAILENGLRSLGEKARSAQIAFFGGSFTALPDRERLALLETTRPFLGEGGYEGIRISTRPDCVDESILDELAAYGVTAVELGVQSMDGKVLAANRRGHTPGDVRLASSMIRARGLSLSLHMMTGMYGSTFASDRETALALAALRPATVRIHPTLVLRETELCHLYEIGQYDPQSLDTAVEECAALLPIFLESGISVIRLGLHDEPSLVESVVAGPYHPAFRELVEGRIMLSLTIEKLRSESIPSGKVRLFVNPRCVSKMIGQKRCNLLELESIGYFVSVKPDSSIPELAVVAERVL